MEDLVTVTYNRERGQMRLQAASIQRFLRPCRHWVIINEPNADLNIWRRYLEPYYTEHELVLVSLEDLSLGTEYPGRLRQQACKLLISKRIQQDYLCLDTKNFFVKPAGLIEWNRYMGNGKLEFVDEPPQDWALYQPYQMGQNLIFRDTIRDYSLKLNVPEPRFYLQPSTPFRIDWARARNMLDPSDPVGTLTKNLQGETIEHPSEFIFYSLHMMDLIEPGTNIILNYELVKFLTLWYFDWATESAKIKNLSDLIDTTNIKVFGIHSKLLDQCGPYEISCINQWLKRLNINYELV